MKQVMWLVVTKVRSESFGLVTEYRHYHAHPLYASVYTTAQVILQCGITCILCAMCVLCMYSTASSLPPRLPCAKFHLCCTPIAELACGEKSRTQSLTHSINQLPSLFYAPGTKAFALKYHVHKLPGWPHSQMDNPKTIPSTSNSGRRIRRVKLVLFVCGNLR